MKVLLVDDSRTIRNIQKSMLAQLGYSEIQEACDGLDAMSKVDAFQPDLLLVDWNMPKMDGLSFVREYRSKGHRAPIIMVTTEADRGRVVDAIKAGVSDYLVKPFTPDGLARRIKETMDRVAAA